MIMCIDFKMIFNKDLDCMNYKNLNDSKARIKLDKWMETFNFFVKILLFKNASQFNAA